MGPRQRPYLWLDRVDGVFGRAADHRSVGVFRVGVADGVAGCTAFVGDDLLFFGIQYRNGYDD